MATAFEPALSGPVSRFAIHQSDLGSGYITDVPSTFELTAESYGATAAFADPEAGMTLLNEWGYRQGYETAYEPEGRAQAVLNGSYYIRMEVHLFETAEGAEQAFAFFEDRLRGQSSSVTADLVGNESSAWRFINGTVADSSVAGAYHRMVSRRGNLVSVVMTWGAEPFMSIEHVVNWSRVVDAKAVGERDTSVPTPTGQSQ